LDATISNFVRRGNYFGLCALLVNTSRAFFVDAADSESLTAARICRLFSAVLYPEPCGRTAPSVVCCDVRHADQRRKSSRTQTHENR